MKLSGRIPIQYILILTIIIFFNLVGYDFCVLAKPNKKDNGTRKGVIEAPPPPVLPKPSVSPAASPLPSPDPSIDPFKGESPEKFDFKPSGLKTLRFSSCGKWFSIPGYVISYSQVLIPLDNIYVKRMLENFYTEVKYDKETGIITFTRENDKVMRMKIDYDVVDYIGKKKKIPIPPRLIYDKPYISPLSFSKFIWAYYSHNEKTNVYYLDSWLLDVNLETSKRGKVTLVAKGTGKLKYRILKLREPTRFVIDVMDACLDGKARAIHHPTLGDIRFSQHELMSDEGNIVRIVVPESEEIEIVMQKPRSQKYVEANLRPRQISAPVQDLATQKITGLQVSENANMVTVTLSASGPFQMEWSRLLNPDNRFFLDIPGMIYPNRKKTINLKSEYLPQIKIAQFQPKPSPIVRMVFKLEDPKKVTIQTNSKTPNKVKIFISKENINPKKAARNGFMITYYPSKGLVICIDPGHGGSDPGAVNRKMGIYEKTITLDIARRLKALLKKEGWTVVMTRNSDRDVTYPGSPDFEELYARARIANDLRAHVFMSIHNDASVNPKTKGVTTYYGKPKDKVLASHVQSSLAMGTGRRNIGIRRRPFAVVRHSKMPAVLVEVCYLSNSSEAKLLRNPKFRQKAAEALMRGLRVYAHKMKLKKK